MRCTPCFKALLALSGAGMLFAGYLSAVKLFSDTCAFGESCPYFFGYPACYYGFAMYLALFLVVGSALLKRIGETLAAKTILLISSLGILFAGYFTIGEIPTLIDRGFRAYLLGLPTCALGLIFYITITIVAINILRRSSEPSA